MDEFDGPIGRYEARVPMPDEVRRLLQMLDQQVEVVDIRPENILIHIEAPDQYELALGVRDIEEGIKAITGRSVELERPTPVHPTTALREAR